MCDKIQNPLKTQNHIRPNTNTNTKKKKNHIEKHPPHAMSRNNEATPLTGNTGKQVNEAVGKLSDVAVKVGRQKCGMDGIKCRRVGVARKKKKDVCATFCARWPLAQPVWGPPWLSSWQDVCTNFTGITTSMLLPSSLVARLRATEDNLC